MDNTTYSTSILYTVDDDFESEPDIETTKQIEPILQIETMQQIEEKLEELEMTLHDKFLKETRRRNCRVKYLRKKKRSHSAPIKL